MTNSQSRLLGIALLLLTAGVVAYLARLNDAADGSGSDAVRQALARKLQDEQEYARARARLDAGAYVVRSKRLSDSEEIEIILIPEGMTAELDTRCVVYKNVELRTSSITCSGILFSQPAPPS